MKTINIALPGKPYNVYLGKGIFNKLSKFILQEELPNRIFVIVDSRVKKLHAEKLKNELQKFGFRFHVHAVQANERNKSLRELEKIYTAMLKKDYSRDTLIISIGGGIVGDIAGFAASTFARGVKYIQIPTTVLAAVDSAVGGKTGVNFLETKNIIGSFYQPEFVLIDTEFFQTLPAEEIRCGLGEILKHAYLSDRKFFNYVNKSIEKMIDLNELALQQVIITSLRYKGGVVSRDEKEKGIRKVLNLGHTFAHAIEVEQKHKLKHGEAVIFGIACSLFLSNKLGQINDDKLTELLSPLMGFRKYLSIVKYDKKKMYRVMQRDKKNREGKIKFVLLKDIGQILIDVEVAEADVYYALENGIGLFTSSGASKG